MTDPGAHLKEKLADLRRWERRKRRERLLLDSLFFTALAAAALVLARFLLPVDAGLLWFAPVVFGAVAAAVFLLRPWREQAFIRSLRQVDQGLKLDERVLTAWEILFRPRERVSPEETLVVEEAAARLATEPLRPLCRRRFAWHALAGPVLVLLAAAGLWLPQGGAPQAASAPSLMARELQEHARELEQRAREQDLTESGRMAEALREMAERQLDEAGPDKSGLEASVGAMVDVLEEMTRSWPAAAGLEWPALSDAALDRLREHMRRSDARKMDGSFAGKSRADLLESLGLSSLDRRPGRSSDMSAEEVQKFLDRVEREARQEQDRRSLGSTQQFLTELLLGDAPDESTAQATRPADPAGDAEKAPAAGRQPGNEPGKGQQEPFDPAFQARVRTHLEGLLGQGPSRGFGFRGEARPGDSTVEEETVVVRYQKQVEAELSSEEIPAEFKETIKNYFLSLGVTRERP